MEEDFVTWPLFIMVLIAACLIVIGKIYTIKRTAIEVSAAYCLSAKILIFLICIGILLSLYHDSTQILNFHF